MESDLAEVGKEIINTYNVGIVAITNGPDTYENHLSSTLKLGKN